jgi:hypothetical protein
VTVAIAEGHRVARGIPSGIDAAAQQIKYCGRR